MEVPLAKPLMRALARSLVLGVTILGAGCASVDPGPFTQFASSLQTLRDGSDAQAGTAATASRQDLVDQVAGGQVSPADLQLEFDASSPYVTTYGFAEREPNYFKLIRFRQGLADLNDAMIAYGQSLVVLSGGGQGGDILPTTAQFDQLAKDLNANAGAAARALGIQIGAERQALLSTAAVQLFKAYIEHKRRKDLVQAIEEVQPRVEGFSKAAQQAVHFLASMVQTDYNVEVLPLMTAEPPNAMPILTLNDTTQTTLATLEAMSSSYAALPQAHRDLKAATKKRPGVLAGLTAFNNDALRLQSLVNELTQANVAASTPQ